jgi:endonuclease YncB( thermonuclease family)
MKRRRSKLSRNLWAMVWVLVIALQLWDHFRGKTTAPRPETDGRFVTLANARFVEDANNDGDSFMIVHDGGEQVLRLYFVDCPEKRQYKLVEGRLKDQAGYFGGLSIPQTLSVGQEAKVFTETRLREQRFTVQTRWERVYDSERVYAMVLFEDGEDLAAKLVKAGLCRIHTKGTMMPDGQREFDFEARLRALEKEAKATQRGAWGKPKRGPAKPKT